MRIFEFVLLVCDLLLLLALVFGGRWKWVWGSLMGATAVSAFVHLAFEGYRWQMIPAYGLTAVLLLLSLYRWRKSTLPNKSHLWRGISVVLGLIALVVSSALPWLLPVPRLPEPTGPYRIGTAVFHLVDPNRPEPYTDEPEDNREIMVQVWYPAENSANGTTVPYLDRLELAGPAIARNLDLPAFFLDHIGLARTHAILNAPPTDSGAPYPVIIFSHGLTGFRSQNTGMIEELVSQGYVVAAIDHTYGNAITVFPDNRVVLYDACRLFTDCQSNPREGHALVQQWAGDISFLLDEMEKWNNEPDHLLNGRLDLAHVGVFGHSTGGGATLEVCWQDSRCTAGLVLDGWTLPVSTEILKSPPSQPFMFLNTPRWLGPDNKARGQKIYAALPNETWLIAIEGTEHFDFSDLPLLSPLTHQLGLSGTIDGNRIVEILDAYAVAFFNQYLKMEPSPLLADNSSPYPEIKLVKHGAR
ncbi:MAG: hypothetical protein D6706_13755 [Chloroflexi bacterium]|nr:MAG: hypothetical protein D6706_13755 [Chloroflexota bacterium]